jgi:hypothetical protein
MRRALQRKGYTVVTFQGRQKRTTIPCLPTWFFVYDLSFPRGQPFVLVREWYSQRGGLLYKLSYASIQP